MYIKKGQNYIEIGNFKSTTVHNTIQWPAPSLSSAVQTAAGHPCRLTTTAASARAGAGEKRIFEKEIARQALDLAKTRIYAAMDLIKNAIPEKFLAHSSWYE